MKLRTWSLLGLDIVLAALVVLMYRYQTVSASFHEVCGILLIGLFVLHLLLHWSWVSHPPKKSGIRRTRYIIDILLTGIVVAMCVTGLMISRTLGLNSETFDIGFIRNAPLVALSYAHSILAYLFLLLIGVHIGLAIPKVFSMIRPTQKIKTSPKVGWLQVMLTGILVAAALWSFILLGGAKTYKTAAKALFTSAALGQNTPSDSRGRHDDNPSNPYFVALESLSIVGASAAVAALISCTSRGKQTNA